MKTITPTLLGIAVVTIICIIDVSKTEQGAKNYATRHGYKTISIRLNGSMHVIIIAEKNNRGKWIKYINPN